MLQESSLFLSTIPSLVFFGPLLCVSLRFALIFSYIYSSYFFKMRCPYTTG